MRRNARGMPRWVTHHELDGKLGSLRHEMRSEFAALRGELKALAEKVDARENANVERFARMTKQIAAVALSNQEVKRTTIATGIAVVLGVAAFNATVLSNMVASFESGRNLATQVNEAAAKVERATIALARAAERANAASHAAPG